MNETRCDPKSRRACTCLRAASRAGSCSTPTSAVAISASFRFVDVTITINGRDGCRTGQGHLAHLQAADPAAVVAAWAPPWRLVVGPPERSSARRARVLPDVALDAGQAA